LAFCLAILAFVLPWCCAYLILLIIIIPLAAWGKILLPFLQRLWRIVLPFAIPILLIQGLFWTGGTPIFGIGPVSFKLEGINFALISVGRLSTLTASFLLLSSSTRTDLMMRSLVQVGLPSQLLYLVITTLQLIPHFQSRAQTILEAQSARGLETSGSFAIRFKALTPLVGPLILGSLLEVEERALALEARAFNYPGPKTALYTVSDSRLEWVFRILLLGLTVVTTFLRLALWISSR
jgi:energy-coupling factor transport system permease protein